MLARISANEDGNEAGSIALGAAPSKEQLALAKRQGNQRIHQSHDESMCAIGSINSLYWGWETSHL